jgi:hypothetical protein
MGHDFRGGIAYAGAQRAVGVRTILIRLVLEIIRQNEDSHGPACERNARGAID